MTFWVGLTGGIASGKTTASQFFSELNVHIINSDEISKKITAFNGEALNILHKRLDKKYFLKDGSLNRKLVKKEIFINIDFKDRLEKILHPIILKNINIEKNKYDNFVYGIIEIPLLYENKEKFLSIVDRVLVVDISYNNQIHRIVKRDNVLENYANTIILNQADRKDRNLIADDIIVNDNDFCNLKEEVVKLHRFYLDFFKKINI